MNCVFFGLLMPACLLACFLASSLSCLLAFVLSCFLAFLFSRLLVCSLVSSLSRFLACFLDFCFLVPCLLAWFLSCLLFGWVVVCFVFFLCAVCWSVIACLHGVTASCGWKPSEHNHRVFYLSKSAFTRQRISGNKATKLLQVPVNAKTTKRIPKLLYTYCNYSQAPY